MKWIVVQVENLESTYFEPKEGIEKAYFNKSDHAFALRQSFTPIVLLACTFYSRQEGSTLSNEL
jgi:hypothetical protein